MGDNGMIKSLALAAQFGFAVAAPMVVFIGGGAWLDNQLSTGHIFFFIGLVLGVVSAGAALYQIAASQPTAKKSGASMQKRNSVQSPTNTDDAGTSPANKERNDRSA